MTSSYSVTTRDNPSKLGFSSRCSRAWPLFKLSLVSFSPLNTYIARYARVRRIEIYCAIARKLSHPTPNRVPSNLFEWPRCEGGRLVKLIYRTSHKKTQLKTEKNPFSLSHDSQARLPCLGLRRKPNPNLLHLRPHEKLPLPPSVAVCFTGTFNLCLGLGR